MGSATSKRVTLEQRTEEFRQVVRKAIRKADECGAVIRPYDGTVSLTWPATVHTSRSRDRKYVLRLSCSVLGGESAHYSWRGRSWRAVFDHAQHDVQVWTENMEACK